MRSFFLFRVYAGCGAAVLLLLCACATRGQNFDYYTLSLSWAPEHCAETNDSSTECAGSHAYGFVLHGLWPDAAQGRGPEHCAGPDFDASLVTDELRAIMPSDGLIEHEWTTHGTCSGLSQTDYFVLAVRAFQMVKIPAELKTTTERVETPPSMVRREFVEANPDFPSAAFQVKEHAGYLAEVRVCLTTDLRPLECGR
jgi:ribonuclease T2